MAQAPSKRNYKQEYAEFHGKPEQVENRAERVKARRIMEKSGQASKGDGKDGSIVQDICRPPSAPFGDTGPQKRAEQRPAKDVIGCNDHALSP